MCPLAASYNDLRDEEFDDGAILLLPDVEERFGQWDSVRLVIIAGFESRLSADSLFSAFLSVGATPSLSTTAAIWQSRFMGFLPLN
jgi:hypothetical protein